MTKRETVERYFEIFFSSHDFESLHDIFESDMRFSGPFFSCDSAQAYVDALNAAPHGDMRYEMHQVTENASAVSTFYSFARAGVVAEMAQLFEFSNTGRVAAIRLIFDPRAFD